MTDLRTDPMATRDGYGAAADRRASTVERLARLALLPTEVPARRRALESAQELIGFWLLWQLEGGFAGLRRLGMSEATIYRKIKQFRTSFGEHPDSYRLAGVPVDPETFLEAFGVSEVELPRVLALAREAPAKLPRPRD